MLSNAIKLAFDDYFNCENRLVKMLSETQKLEFVYDYMGRRREKQVFAKDNGVWTLTTHKKFVYNKYKLIKEIDALTATIKQQFVWNGDNLLSLHEDNKNYLYVADGNKNITQLINLTTGTTANNYTYTPFGKLINEVESVENPFKFSSEYHDETGLVYYNYRYYNPKDGKWLSRDPLGEFIKKGKEYYLNVLYCYVGNNLINKTDTIGLWWWDYSPPKGGAAKDYDKCSDCKRGDKLDNKSYEGSLACVMCVIRKQTTFSMSNGLSGYGWGIAKGIAGAAVSAISGGWATGLGVIIMADGAADVAKTIQGSHDIKNGALSAILKYCGADGAKIYEDEIKKIK